MAASTIFKTPTSNINKVHTTTFKGGDIGRDSSSFRNVSLPQKPQHFSISSSPKTSTCFFTKNICTRQKSEKSRGNIITNACILSKFWRELQGSNDWEYLVQPLHPLLRQEIIRYGEFVTACYKAFDLDPESKRYLNCKYGKKTMFEKVGLQDSGYLITKYIYATPNINIPTQNGSSCGRWVGYVAVSSDPETKRVGRRDILVTFRGTVTNPEWIANLMSSLTRAGLDPHNPRPDVMVESGFLSLYTSNESDTSKFGLESCREQLLSELGRVINTYKNEEMSITIAGHSMGSSLGLLLAYDISELGLNKDFMNRKIPVTVFSFAGPRVGNLGFKERLEKLEVKVLRIVNVNDPITKMPGFLFNENFRVFLGGKYYELPWKYYAHVGVELAIDFFKMQNPSCVHDLESYINLLRLHKRSPAARVQCDEQKCARFLSKARDFLATSAQNFDISPWKDAACNMVNLVQSQRTT